MLVTDKRVSSASKIITTALVILSLVGGAGAAGDVWAWGGNSRQLGDGTTTHRYNHVQISGLTGVTAISAGLYHSIAQNGSQMRTPTLTPTLTPPPTPTPTVTPTPTPTPSPTLSATTSPVTRTPSTSPTEQPAQITPPVGSALGDDFGTAKTLPGSGTYTGKITYEDRKDYYVVTTQSEQILSVAAIPGNDKLALILEIYNYKRSSLYSEVGSFGEIVEGMWTSGSEEENYLYYIAIKQVTGTGDYNLEVLIDSQNDGNSNADAGDTAERALLLPPLNATYSGFLQGDDKSDYYMLNLTPLKNENFTHNKITVSVSPKPKLGPYVRIYNKDKKELTSDFGVEGEGVTVSVKVPMDEDRVYIKIEKTFGYGSYAFGINILPIKDSSIAVAAIVAGGGAAAGAGYYLARRRRE